MQTWVCSPVPAIPRIALTRVMRAISALLPMAAAPRMRSGATRALSRQWPRSRNISRFFPTGLMRSRKLEQVCSVQPRSLEEFCAVRRVHAHVECDAFTIKRKRHFDAGASERPNLAVKAGECRYAVTLDCNNDVTRLDFGARGRPLRRDADHN